MNDNLPTNPSTNDDADRPESIDATELIMDAIRLGKLVAEKRAERTASVDPARMRPVHPTRQMFDELLVNLALWSLRDPSIPQPRVTTAGHDAVSVLDAMLRDLHSLRSALVTEIRQHQDACAARTDALLERLRQDTGAVVELPDDIGGES